MITHVTPGQQLPQRCKKLHSYACGQLKFIEFKKALLKVHIQFIVAMHLLRLFLRRVKRLMNAVAEAKSRIYDKI